ncbi:MAG: hypothetical protein RSD28_03485 [Lachnospiraceae bacterium]
MTNNSLNKQKENQKNLVMEGFLYHHPGIVFLVLFIGLPVVSLLLMLVMAVTIMFPVSLLMGWM